MRRKLNSQWLWYYVNDKLKEKRKPNVVQCSPKKYFMEVCDGIPNTRNLCMVNWCIHGYGNTNIIYVGYNERMGGKKYKSFLLDQRTHIQKNMEFTHLEKSKPSRSISQNSFPHLVFTGFGSLVKAIQEKEKVSATNSLFSRILGSENVRKFSIFLLRKSSYSIGFFGEIHKPNYDKKQILFYILVLILSSFLSFLSITTDVNVLLF